MKVLIIGLGSIAKKHIDAIKLLDINSEIFALRRNLEDSSKISGVMNVLEVNFDIDFIIISNPTSEHGKTIKKFLALGKPFFIEKPLFESLDYKRLVSEINSLNVPTYVACNLRFLDSIKFVKNFIFNKRINEVNIYSGSFLPEWRPNIDFRKIYSANKEMGGGVHIDLIHEIDYLTFLFGFPNNVSKKFTSNSSLKISSVDYANYLLSYSDFSANVILNYYRRTPKRTLEIVCEDGELLINIFDNSVQWNGELIYSSIQNIRDTYFEQMKYFLNEVIEKKGENSFNNINEAYKILKLCLED